MSKAAKAAANLPDHDTRERILRAALAAFSERGFDGATTRDIAARAGVNHGLIPYYYGDKSRLWRAAVDRAFGELDAALRLVHDAPDAVNDRERVRSMLRGYVRFVARNPEFVRLMHEEGKRRGPRMRWLVDRHVKPLYDAIVRLLAESPVRGALPADIPPVHLHYILAGSVGVIFHQAEECKRLTGVDPFDDAAVENHVRAVEYLLLGPPDRSDARRRAVTA